VVNVILFIVLTTQDMTDNETASNRESEYRPLTPGVDTPASGGEVVASVDMKLASTLNTVGDWATEAYFPGSTVEVEHLRSLTNDVFLIRRDEERFVLKIYGDGWRDESAIAWEVDLLNHFARKGVGVADAVHGNDGEAVRPITLSGQTRQAVLFEYARGEKPQPPFKPDLYRAEGKAVATMHAAGDDFKSPHHRAELDLAYLIDDPIESARRLVGAEDGEFLSRFASQLKERIGVGVEKGLDWGPVHGDMTQDNLHVASDGKIYFYDFDSGGMGWRASDIQGWAIRDADDAKWEAFLGGYREVRNLSDNDIETAPFIFGAWEMWGLSSDFTKRIGQSGEQAVEAYLRVQIARLRRHESSLSEWEARKH
jgi:Ser/Thr protein kinase RdoA (MazF antagonist)